MKAFLKEIREAKKALRDLHSSVLESASAIKPLEDGLDNAGKKASIFRRSLTSLRNILSSKLGKFLGGAALVAFGRSVLQASSNLEELDSKARVVFGETFAQVAQRTREIADEVGRASSAILQFSADLGAVIQATGITGQRLADMSTELAKLAVDMASFHNTSDIQAFNALRSAITGELEPLKRFGVVMTQANLKAFALSQGVDQTIESMNQAQLTALRYAFILARTETSQGDAERTAGSYANQVKRLSGQWTEFKETLGDTGGIAVATAAVRTLGEALNLVQITVGLFATGVKNSFQEVANAGVKMLQLLGFADVGVKDFAARSGAQNISKLSGENIVGKNLSSADVARLSSAVAAAKAKKQADNAGNLQKELAELGAGFSGGSKAGGKSPADEQKELNKAFEEMVRKNKELLIAKREELKLKKELGELTEDEERMLERINERVEFQEDKINDATKAWREQARAVEEVEEKIEQISDSIQKERQRLADSIADIERSSAEKRVEAAASLFDELDAIEKRRVLGQGVSEELQLREKEIKRLLDGVDRPTREQGRDRADESVFDAIDREKDERIAAAEEESEARLRPLEDELAQAQRNRTEIVAMEQEKRSLVLSALSERQTATFTTFQAIEARTKAHVTKQIAEFNRLKRATQGAAGFARGGFVSGPGGPTADKIPAFLSDGEFVINAAATKLYRPLIERINSSTLRPPKFANGGMVTNNSTKSANITVKNYGSAANQYADPRRAKWDARTFLG